jgi:hypothetical protein
MGFRKSERDALTSEGRNAGGFNIFSNVLVFARAAATPRGLGLCALEPIKLAVYGLARDRPTAEACAVRVRVRVRDGHHQIKMGQIFSRKISEFLCQTRGAHCSGMSMVPLAGRSYYV